MSETNPPTIVTGIPDGISSADVQEAILALDRGDVPHQFRDSTGYDLVHNGKKYPPKAVIGIAARRLCGRVLDPNEFSGGEDSKCFKVLRELGFEIVPKDTEAQSSSRRIWFENTKSSHEHGGPGWEFGTCLWSPSKAKDGKDWYNAMREVRKGDLILNCCDGQFSGTSIAKDSYQERSDEPPKPGNWANMPPYYRIELESFVPMKQPIPISDLFEQSGELIKQQIRELRNSDKDDYQRPPFDLGETEKLKLGQTYLTHCPTSLYQTICEWAKIDNDSNKIKLPNPDASHVLTTLSAPRFWAISLGEGGRLWNECQEKSIIAIGWDELGDLRKYQTREEIAEDLRAKRPAGSPAPLNDSLACYQFAHEMEVGDYAIAKIGRNKLLGVGIVESTYQYDPARSQYHHVRQVRWIHASNQDLPHNAWVPLKTLTDVSDYPKTVDYVTDNYLTERVEIKPSIEILKPFSLDEAMEGLYLPRTEVEGIISALRRKKNVILQGPPGVGKTFIARRLAYALMATKDKSHVEMVQFHQSYAYEDFIQGYRPRESGGFQRRDGIFYDFCNRARLDRDRPYVFVIDEINRGNLSKIFGELMMLIESDKRGPEFAIPLTYSESSGERFSIPENIHVIGLMNTADRSLALVDYALRRRFVFFNLTPQFQSEAFQNNLMEQGVPRLIVDRVVMRMTSLNKVICDDEKQLGKGFAIGHSFFCLAIQANQAFNWENWYREVVECEIAPLLHEYWFDAPNKAYKQVERLLEP